MFEDVLAGDVRAIAKMISRAAAAKRIEARIDGTYRVDDRLELRFELSGPDRPTIREQNGMRELLVPVRFQGGRARIVEEFVW